MYWCTFEIKHVRYAVLKLHSKAEIYCFNIEY